MYAIFDDRGRQHWAEQGQKILLDIADSHEPGATIEFDRVLLVGGTDAEPKIGLPHVEGAKVTVEVIDRKKMKKIHVRTFKRRKDTKRHIGHRQQMTEVRVSSISA